MALATPLGKPLARQSFAGAGQEFSFPRARTNMYTQGSGTGVPAIDRLVQPRTFSTAGVPVNTSSINARQPAGDTYTRWWLDPNDPRNKVDSQGKPIYQSPPAPAYTGQTGTVNRTPTATELQNIYNKNWSEIGAPRMSEGAARNEFALNNLQQQLDAMLKGKEQQLGNNQAEIDLKKQLQDLNASDIGIDKGAASRGIMLASQLIGLNNSQLQSEQAQFTNLEKNLAEVTRISREKASLQLASQTRQSKSDAIARGSILSRGYESTIKEFNRANELENQELTEKYRSGMEGYKIGREQSQIKADERHKELSETVSRGYDTINKLSNDLARVGINKKLLDLELKNAASQLGVDKILAQLQYAEKKGQLDGNLKDLYYGLVDQIAQKTQTIAQNPWAMDVLRNSVWNQSPTSQKQAVIAPARPGEVGMT